MVHHETLLGFDLDEESWFERVRAYSGAKILGRIGPYELLAEAGRGGQGVVYKARQPGTGRVIALKRVSAGGAGSASFRRRFEREARTSSALNHPNIVTIFGCETVEGQAVLLMEFIDGLPVDRWAESLGPAGHPQRTEPVVGLFETLARAVSHAHQHGVIHRDLKPSNILVVCADKEGTEPRSHEATKGLPPDPAASVAPSLRGFVASSAEPKVLDFGLARLLSPYVGDSLFETHTTGFVGTPAYASPEHFLAGDGAGVDVRSDVYSVGVMLYQALTGRLPYRGAQHFTSLMRAIDAGDPARPASVVSGFPRELEAIMLKALAREPARRYQSMDALADDLRRYRSGETVAAHPLTTLYQVRKLVRRHRLAFGSALVIFVLLVAFAITTTVLGLRERAARQNADLNSYVANLAAADIALRVGDAASARSYLERAPAALRNWEWRHLQFQTDQSVGTRRDSALVLLVDREGRPILAKNEATFRWEGTPADAHAFVRGNDDRTTSISSRYAVIRVQDPGHPEQASYRLSELAGGRVVGEWPAEGSHLWVCLSPDDRTFAVGLDSGELKVMRLSGMVSESSQPPGAASSGPRKPAETDVRRIRVDDSRLGVLAFTPNGRMLAVDGSGGRVTLLDANTLEITRVLQVGERPCYSLCFSSDGRTLAVGSLDKHVSLWDVASGSLIWRSAGHAELVAGLSFSANGALVASASWDRSVRVWKIADGSLVARLLGHEAAVDGVSFLGDERLVSVDKAGTLKTWNLAELRPQIATGKYQRILRLAASPGATQAGWMAISEGPDDSWRNDRVSLIDLRTRGRKGVLWLAYASRDWSGGSFNSIEISPDGRWLAVGGADGTVRLWRGDDLTEWTGGDEAPPPALQLASDEHRESATVGLEGAVSPVAEAWPLTMCFDPGGERLVLSRVNGELNVWDIASGELLMKRAAPASPDPSTATLSPDGTRLAVQLHSGVLQLLRASDLTVLRQCQLTGSAAQLSRPVFSPDGEMLVTRNEGNTLALRRATDLEMTAVIDGHADLVETSTFSPDGSRLVTGGTDYKLKVWDTVTGRELATLHGHELHVLGVAFLDEDTLVSGGMDNTVRFWDAGIRPGN